MKNTHKQTCGSRVLIISHGHPVFSKGGGEVAAYNLYAGLKKDARIEACWFLGAMPSEPTGGIHMLVEDEYIWRQGIASLFLMKSAAPDSTLKDFTAFLKLLNPDVIHFHHYMHVGLDSLGVARKACPNAKIILTLHEMLAICLSDGQMVKQKNFALCYGSSMHACHQCFPQYSPEDFWLRKRYTQAHFENVDMFISPSDFLRKRYIDWGIPEKKIVMIENGLPEIGSATKRPLANGESRNRIGFFGQITIYKGVDTLLEALAKLPEETVQKLSLEIHGANLEAQRPEFQKRVQDLLGPLEKAGVVRMMGPYSREEIHKRMSNVDWVIVPSIWWENSPVVIQEAFSLGKPVICSDIGGMEEKVAHDVDGIHFQAGNPASLASTLTALLDDEKRYDVLHSGINFRGGLNVCLDAHMKLYVQ